MANSPRVDRCGVFSWYQVVIGLLEHFKIWPCTNEVRHDNDAIQRSDMTLLAIEQLM